MKRYIVLISALCILTGCGNTSDSRVDNSSSIKETAKRTEQTKQAETKPAAPTLSVGVSDKYIIESDDGYTLVIQYGFENNTGEPKSFIYSCTDSVYLDGIECECDYNDYLGSETSIIPYVSKSDNIMSGKTAYVRIGYTLKRFSPDKEHNVTVRLTEPFDSSYVIQEVDIKSTDIRIISDKGDE